ncbi:hypothetical protein EV360DRAFT_71141 [Lentinula raphanica]|nr:hypothetical protein EV360DRAFT_71141 [Lentinula raphanica]
MFNSNLILDTQTQMFWDYSIYFVELSIIVYDYLLTLDAEVERYWILRTRKDLTLSTALFFINRYLTLLGIFPIFVFTLWPEIIPGLMVSGSALLSGEGSAAWSVILQRCSRTLDLMHWIYIALEMSTVNRALWWQLYLASKTNLEQPPFSGGQINCIAGETRQHNLFYNWIWLVVHAEHSTLRMRGLFLRRGIGAMLMRDGLDKGIAVYFQQCFVSQNGEYSDVPLDVGIEGLSMNTCERVISAVSFSTSALMEILGSRGVVVNGMDEFWLIQESGSVIE